MFEYLTKPQQVMVLKYNENVSLNNTFITKYLYNYGIKVDEVFIHDEKSLLISSPSQSNNILNIGRYIVLYASGRYEIYNEESFNKYFTPIPEFI